MGLFKSKAEKYLDGLIRQLEMNMANNYKDNAQADLKEFEAAYTKMVSEGEIKGKSEKFYGVKLGEYKGRLRGYTHKDQTPYWTKK